MVTRRFGKIGMVAAILGLLLVIGVGIEAGRRYIVEPQRVLSAGVAIGRGGLGDRSFNDSAYAGLQRAQDEMGVRFRIAELERDTEAATLRTLASAQHDIVIALGQEYTDALTIVAAEFPQQAFAIIDASVVAPNVTSVVFRELEGDFLAGALSAMLASEGTVGFLGGADIPIIRRIEHGWQQGVRHVRPNAEVLIEYAGGENDFSGFAKPALGQELAAAMYERGAGVVYAAAGRTALGAIEAAEQAELPVITTGSDQRWIAPAVVVTSRTKNMDVAVYTLLSELRADQLVAGRRVLDLATNGVGLAPLNDAPYVTAEMRSMLEQIRSDLADGTLVVEEREAE